MPLQDDQKLRYARQLILKEIGGKGQEKLLSAKVLVIGAGGLGSAAISYLAAAGIGTIGIADCDRVELSNLQRQILHTTARVGEAKADSARKFVGELNPDVKVELHPGRVNAANIAALIEPYDFVLDCVDRFGTKFLINDACVLGKKPYSHAGVVRFSGQALTYVPGQGPCLRCLIGSVPHGATCASVGIVGAAAAVLGGVQALETIKYLLGAGELLTGRVFYFDGLSMTARTAEFCGRDPACAVCSETPSIVSLCENAAEYEDCN